MSEQQPTPPEVKGSHPEAVGARWGDPITPERPLTRFRTAGPGPLLGRAFAINAPLTVAGLAMVAALAVALVGLVVDRQSITGVPAWLKPAKFAFSFGLYCFTLIYLVSFVRGRRIVLAIATVTIALGVMIEMALIALQASRGTTSHFNFSTPLNAAIFTTMGIFIVLVWTMSLSVAVLLLVQPLPDPVWASTLRLGLLLSLIGMAVAYPMLRATPAQIATAHGGMLLYSGAHSVGVPDGGPGLPLLGWSTVGGDLRIPHFIGVHSLQVLLLVGWILSLAAGWLDVRHRMALLWVAALSYLGLIAILLWQALRGQSIVAPDIATLGAFAALGTFAVLSTLGVLAHGRWRPPR